MLNFGVNLALYGFVGAILVNLFMLVKFVARASQVTPIGAEIFHTLFMGGLGKSYLSLLAQDGIVPTVVDELLYRIDILLKFALLLGVVMVVFGVLFAI
jgi:hypothetical protein